MSLEPKGWAVFSGSGNARMWTASRERAEAFVEEGETLTPLYALTPAQVAMLEGVAAPSAAPPQAAAQADPPQAAQPEAPFAFYVYIPDQQNGYYVDELDEAIDDLTNCECEVTPLYASPPADTPAEAQGEREALTDEQIIEIRDSLLPSQGNSFDVVDFARAILAANERKKP